MSTPLQLRMDDATATRLRKRLVLSAARKGAKESTEDIAHDVIVKWLERGDTHQTTDQAVIDALRRTSGRRGFASYERKRNLSTANIIEPMDTLARMPGAPVNLDSDADFERLIRPLESFERAVICLIYVWGLKGSEIALCFGVDESTISQRLKRATGTLSKTVAVKELSPLQGVREEVEEVAKRKRKRSAAMEAFLRQALQGGSRMECETDQSVEEKQFWSMESHHAESVPEWFA